MTKQYIDVFNGDADGLCALVQLRRANPQPSLLITGVKRDINLLHGLQVQGDEHITVLDISFEKNAKDVQRLLDQGCTIDYFDHHKTGDLINHPKLNSDIDLSPNTCTSLIMDKHLKGRFHAWAITAAFGDNLLNKAYELGLAVGFNDAKLTILKQLGMCLNYNGYGSSLDDLFFHPAELYQKLKIFDTPFEFVEHDAETYQTLIDGYQQDMNKTRQIKPLHTTAFSEVVLLPNAKWARRVSGVFSNEMANRDPDKAHAVLTEQELGHYLVSIRAPLNRNKGADVLASQFPTGGGRKAAAGINVLPQKELSNFINAFDKQFLER